MTPTSFSPLDFIEYDFGTRTSVPPQDLVTVHQIHSARVIANHAEPRRNDDADALIENTPGVAIGVKTADCVPILLADPVHRAVAAIHAGWRGTAANIAPAAIRAMLAEFATDPSDLRAVIGPAIGPCCYEVGPEVAAEFGMIIQDRGHLNLKHINRRQLEAAGLLPQNISVSSVCTRCDLNYHSFRRDREAAGRLLSWVRVQR